MKLRSRFILAILLLVSVVSGQEDPNAICPPCYSNRTSLRGHGWKTEGSTRRLILNVWVGDGWDSQAIKDKIKAATECANMTGIQLWGLMELREYPTIFS